MTKAERAEAERTERAASVYLARKARKAHPLGRFDNAGRWEPSDDERCDCCSHVRSPSRAWRYSLMLHCRTLAHVAALFNVPVEAAKRAVRRMS